MDEGASNLCTQLPTIQDQAASSNIPYSGKSHPGTSALNTSTSGFYVGDPSTDSTASVLQTNTAVKNDSRIYEKNNVNSPAEKHDSSYFLPGLVTQSSLTDNYQTGSHNSSAQAREQSGINKSEESFNVKEYQMIISASSLLSSLCTTHVSTFPQPAVSGYKANQNNNNNNIVKSDSRQGPQADYKQQTAKSSPFSHPYTVLNRGQTAANSASAANTSTSGDGRKTYTDRPVVTITHTSSPSAHDLNVSIQTSPLLYTKKEKPTGQNFRTVNVPSNVKQLHKPSTNSPATSTSMTPFIQYTTIPSTSGNLPHSSKPRSNFAGSNSSEKLVTVQTKPVSTKKPRSRASRKKEAAEKLPVTFDDDDDDNDFIPVGMCQLPMQRKPDGINANLFSPESTLAHEYNLLSQDLGSTYTASPSQEYNLQEKVVQKHQEPSQVFLLEQAQQPNVKIKDSDLHQFGNVVERSRVQHTNPIHQPQFEQKHETVVPFVGGDRTKTLGFLKNQGLIIHHQQPQETYTESVSQRSNTLDSVQQNQPNVDHNMQFLPQFPPKEHVKSAAQEQYKEPGCRQPEKSKHNLLHSTPYLSDSVTSRPETSHQHHPPKLAEQLLQQPRVEQILQQNNDQTSKLEIGLSKQDQTTAFRSVTPTSVHVHHNPSLNQQHPEIAKMLNSPVSPRQPASPRQSISPRRTVSPHPSSISPSQFVSPYPRQATSPRQSSKTVVSVPTSTPHPSLSKPTTSPQTKQSHSPRQSAVSWQSQSTSQPSQALTSNMFGQGKSFSGQLPASKAVAEQMNQAINTLVPIGHPVTVNLESVQLPLESTDVPHTKSGYSSSMEQNKLFSLASTHHDVYQMQQVSSDLSFDDDDDEPIPYSFPSSQPSQIFSPGQVIHHRPPERKQTSVKAKQRPGSGMSAQLPSPSVLSSTVPVPSVQNASTIWQPLQHVEPKPDQNVQLPTQDSNAQPSKDAGRISSQSQDASRQNVVYPKGPVSGAMSSSSEMHQGIQWQASSEFSQVSGKPTIEMQLYPTPSSISQSSASPPDSTPAIQAGVDRDTSASSVLASNSNTSNAQQVVESTKEAKSQDSLIKRSGVEDLHPSTPQQQRSEAPRRDDGLKVLSKIASECYVKTVAEENKSVPDQNKVSPSEATVSPSEENSKEGQIEKKDDTSSLSSTTEYRLTRKKLNETLDKSENQDADGIGKEADGKDLLSSSSSDVPKREVRQRKPKKPFEQEDQPARKNAKQNQKTTPTFSGQKKLPTPSKKGQTHKNLQNTLKNESEEENKLSQNDEKVRNSSEPDDVTKSNNVDLKTGVGKKKSDHQKNESDLDVSTKALDMQEMSSRRLSQRLLVKEKETKKEDNEESARRSKRQSTKIDYKEGTESVEDSSSVKSARSSRRTSPSYSSSSVESKERMTTRSANRKEDESADKSLNKKQNDETDQKSTVKKPKSTGPDDKPLNKKQAVEKIDDKLRVKRRKDEDQPADAKKRKDSDTEDKISKIDTRGSSKELTVQGKRVTRTPATTGGRSQKATSAPQVKGGLQRSHKSPASELRNLNNSASTPRRMTTRQLISEKETPNSSSEATDTRKTPAEGRRSIKKKTEDSILGEVDSKSVPGDDKKQNETESATDTSGNEKNTSFSEETPKRKIIKSKSRKLKSGYKRKRWRKFRGNKNLAVKLKTDSVAKTDKTDPVSDENDEKQSDNKKPSAQEEVMELKITDEKISVDVTESKKTELHKTAEPMDTDVPVIKSCSNIEEDTQHKPVIKTSSLDTNVAPGPNDTDLSISVVNQTKDFGQTQFHLESNRQKMVMYKLVPVYGEDVSEIEDTFIPISGYFVPGGKSDRILLPQNFMSGALKTSTTALGWGTTSSGNEQSEPRIPTALTSADKVSKVPPHPANLEPQLSSYSPLRTTPSTGVSNVAPSTTWPPTAQTSSATWPLQLPPPVPTPPPSVGEPGIMSSKKTWPVSQPQASPSTYRPSPSWNTTPPSLLSSSPLSSSSSTWNMSSTSSLPLSHQNSLTWTAPPTSQEATWRSSTSHQAVESWSKEYFPSSNSTPVLPQTSSQGHSVNQNYSLDSGTPNTQTPTYQSQDQTGSSTFYGNGVPQDSDFTDARQENLIQGFLRQVTSNAGGFSQELSGFNLGQQDFAYLENKLRQELSPNTLFSAVAAYDDSSQEGPGACPDGSLQDSINLVHTVNLDMEEGNMDSSANLDLSGITGHTPRPVSVPKGLDSQVKTPHRMGMQAAGDIESPALLDSSACLDGTPQMDSTPQLESPLAKDDKVKKEDKKVMKERKHQYDIITENEVRRYKCKTCGKMFGNATIYRHLRTHDPDYKVTCHLCEKKYTQKTSLLLHIKKCHSDQLPQPAPSHAKEPEVDAADKDHDKTSPSKRQRRASSSANPLAASLDESEILKQQETHRQVEELRRLKAEKKLHGKATGSMVDDVTVVSSEVRVNEDDVQDNTAMLEHNSASVFHQDANVEPVSVGRRDSSHDEFADSIVHYSRDGTPVLASDPGAYISSSPRTPSYQITGLLQSATKPQYQLNAPQPVMSTLSPFHADTVPKSSLTSAQGDSQVSDESLYGNTERGSQDGTAENTSDKLQPFQCEICYSQLTSRNGYTLHMQRHNKAKSKLCSFCDKTFHTSQELKSHERTHTGEKPYKCPICYYAFAHSGSFVSHKKGHTNRGETEPFLVVDGVTQYPSSFKKPRIVDPDNVKRAADGSEIEPKKKKRKKKPSTDSLELDNSGASMPGPSSSTENSMSQVARETSVIRRNSLDPAGEKQAVSHHADNVLARRMSLNDQMLTMSGQGLVSGSGQIYNQNLDEQEIGLSAASRDKDNSTYLQQGGSYALTRSNVDSEYYDSSASYTERPHQRDYSSTHADTSSSSHDYYTQVKYYPRSSSSDQYSPSNQDQLRTVPVNLALGKTPQYPSNMDSYYSSQQQYQYDVTGQSVDTEYQQEDYEALAQFKPDPAGTEIVKKLLQHYNVPPSTYQEAAPVDYSQIQSTSDYSRTDPEPVLPMYSEHDIAAPPSYSASVQQKQYYSARQRAQEYDGSLLMSSERPLTSPRDSNIMLPPQPDRQYALTSSQAHLQTDVYRSENTPRYATPDTPRYATPDTPRYATPDSYRDEQYSTQMTRPPSQPYSQTYDVTPSRDYYPQPLPKIESLARDSNSDKSKDALAKSQ